MRLTEKMAPGDTFPHVQKQTENLTAEYNECFVNDIFGIEVTLTYSRNYADYMF